MIECPLKPNFLCAATPDLIREGNCIGCSEFDKHSRPGPQCKTSTEIIASLEDFQDILSSVNPFYGMAFNDLIERIKKEVGLC